MLTMFLCVCVNVLTLLKSFSLFSFLFYIPYMVYTFGRLAITAFCDIFATLLTLIMTVDHYPFTLKHAPWAKLN